MDYLHNKKDLRLLRYLLSGEGVHVNVSELARDMDVHWATAKKKLETLYKKGLLNPPIYPFIQLYDEYPLLVLVRADMPRTQWVKEFYQNDSHIFAAFTCMEGLYNTFLIEFFESLEDYHSWRNDIVKENKIPSREERTPANADFFSNKLTFKYEPNSFIEQLEDEFEREGHVELGGEELDREFFHILNGVMKGEHIRTNHSYLARELGVNRKTVKRRIEKLLSHEIIDEPKCFFPKLLVPPSYNLIITMIEAIAERDQIKDYLKKDPNVPRAVETSTKRYNFLVFTAFRTVEDFFDWSERIRSEFPESIGAISKTILSSKMIHLINPSKVSLGFIEKRLKELSN